MARKNEDTLDQNQLFSQPIVNMRLAAAQGLQQALLQRLAAAEGPGSDGLGAHNSSPREPKQPSGQRGLIGEIKVI